MIYTEKNKMILDTALGSMKGYTPPDHVWNGIVQNRFDGSLQSSLSSSDGFDPPDFIWDSISDGLTELESEQVLKDAIKKLKGYVPPKETWSFIEKDVHGSGKVIGMTIVKRLMAIAAIGLLFWMVKPFFTEKDGVSIAYSEETVEMNEVKMDWNEDEDAFQMVSEWCKSGNIVCQLPEFKALKSEMDELNDAKNMLKAEISNYETDNTLIAQLTKIEIERGNVLKQMISMM